MALSLSIDLMIVSFCFLAEVVNILQVAAVFLCVCWWNGSTCFEYDVTWRISWWDPIQTLHPYLDNGIQSLER